MAFYPLSICSLANSESHLGIGHLPIPKGSPALAGHSTHPICQEIAYSMQYGLCFYFPWSEVNRNESQPARYQSLSCSPRQPVES